MKVLVGIAMLGMLAVVGCGGTVVVTATPTATSFLTSTPMPTATVTPAPTPTPAPTATVTPAPTPTPDLRAILRAECNKKMANAMRLWGTAEEEASMLLDITDEDLGYWARWMKSTDVSDPSGTIFDLFIEDLEDGEC